MDEVFFGGIQEKLRMVSITDSTMMRIVHGAMNKAHERVKSKEGAVERLMEISKFYELAVMQLEGCMKFVQDETTHEEEVLAGLSQIRDQLRGRLCHSQRAISDKDRELSERAEAEARLRLALEAKDAELAALRATLDGRDGDFSHLKSSVDHHVWKIRQRLEPDHRFREDEAIGGDIDALKETLDVAFREMIKNHEYLLGGRNVRSEISIHASSSSLSVDSPDGVSGVEREHQDSGLEALMIQETCGVCRDINDELRIREEISMLVIREVLKDFGSSYNSNEAKIETRYCRKCNDASVVDEEMFQSVALGTAVESLVQNVDVSVQSGDSESDENNAGLHFRVLQCDNLGDGNAGNSLTSSLSSGFADPLVICDRETPLVLHFDSMLASVREFFQVMVDFEKMVGEKLEVHSLRLEDIDKRNLNQLVQVASSMKEQKSLYRKAFLIRCQNLHKAEIEVDLLGDQVEVLLSLIHKVYSSIQNYSLIPQPSVWTSDMLMMIQVELNKNEIVTSSEI